MAEDAWQDEAAAQLLQQGAYLPFDDEGDLPVGEKPPPIDPRAKANMDAYFAQRGRRGSTATSAEAAPAQLLPAEQRRSTNVDTRSKAMYDEIPDRFYPASPGGIYRDLANNPHSREYIETVLNDMLEGAQGHAVYMGMHPLLSQESASNSKLATQAGIQDLKRILAREGGDGSSVLEQRLQLQGDYDIAIAKAYELLNDYNAP